MQSKLRKYVQYMYIILYIIYIYIYIQYHVVWAFQRRNSRNKNCREERDNNLRRRRIWVIQQREDVIPEASIPKGRSNNSSKRI